MKRKISIISAFALLFGLSSCLKDEAVINNDGLRNIIEFQNVGSIKSTTTDVHPVFVPITLEPTAADGTFEGIIRYSGADVAPQDIVVNFQKTDAVITEFNAKTSGTKYSPIAPSEITAPTTVTIPKGQREAKFKVVVKVANLDQTKSNAIAYKITSASVGTISGNFGTIIFSTPIKSIWEGTYTVTIHNNFGSIDANIGSAPFTETGIKLTTVGPNQVQVNGVSQTYSGYTNYQFNGNNTGISSIVAYSGSNLATSIQGVDLLDAINRKFTVRWTWAGRGVTETWVRTGN